MSMVAEQLFLLTKVGNSNPHGVLDDHNFAVADQRGADQNVDVVPGRARNADDALWAQFQNLRDGHDPAAELYLDVHRHVGEVCDLFERESRISLDRVSLDQIDGVLAQFVDRIDHFGVGFVAALVDDQVGEFGGDIHGG